MDEELEELESILFDHLGRTPLNTPSCSQNSSSCVIEEDDDDDECFNENVDDLVEGRARVYVLNIDNSDTSDSASDKENDSDECEDMQKVSKFMREGCGCLRECHKNMRKEQVVDHILRTYELTKNEKDISIMSALNSFTDADTKKGAKRKRAKNLFLVVGISVCKKTFMLYFNTGKHCLGALIKHARAHGVTARVHGNKGRIPKHAINYEDVLRVAHFINNYADECGIPQPAAPRGIDNIPCTYLPSNTTKINMHKEYTRASAHERVISLTSFKDIWRSCLPHPDWKATRRCVCYLRETPIDDRECNNRRREIGIS